MSRLVVFAPNWLGDAVMALPALADVRRASPQAAVAVAARPAVAPLFGLVPGLSAVITLDPRAPGRAATPVAIGSGRFDGALLFPNSFHVAWTAWRAGIRERWGYAADCRHPLLTRSVRRPYRVHQAAYYQQLTRALGFSAGPLVPSLDVSAAQREAGRSLLADAGWDGRTSYVVLAPGAAYGGAKRWPSRSFAEVARHLVADGLVPVLIGTRGDAPAAAEVLDALGTAVRAIDLTGRTNLLQLAAVLVGAHGLVTNDSGAMHLAAALGVPVTAIFGPTDETATHPLGRAPHTVLTHPVWCRPCMLRECPLSHACMRGVSPEAVARAVGELATHRPSLLIDDQCDHD
ncbi:MAG: lipopolysaccharide heptosyltransferase II [Vicinamibacterales bacterium]